jgi:hypothetical protein
VSLTLAHSARKRGPPLRNSLSESANGSWPDCSLLPTSTAPTPYPNPSNGSWPDCSLQPTSTTSTPLFECRLQALRPLPLRIKWARSKIELDRFLAGVADILTFRKFFLRGALIHRQHYSCLGLRPRKFHKYSFQTGPFAERAMYTKTVRKEEEKTAYGQRNHTPGTARLSACLSRQPTNPRPWERTPPACFPWRRRNRQARPQPPRRLYLMKRHTIIAPVRLLRGCISAVRAPKARRARGH